MGVVLQAAHDDVDERGGETFRQRRRNGGTNTRFNLKCYEVGRCAVERQQARHELPHEHAKAYMWLKVDLAPPVSSSGAHHASVVAVLPPPADAVIAEVASTTTAAPKSHT